MSRTNYHTDPDDPPEGEVTEVFTKHNEVSDFHNHNYNRRV